MAKPNAARKRTDYHSDGSVRAQGSMLAGKLHGYWEWYRKDGTRMRSGHFDRGVQTGDWITYDARGDVHKVTRMNPSSITAKAAARKRSARG